MGRTKYTLQDVLKAIKGTGGIKSEVARNLGCSRSQVYTFMDRWVTVREAMEEEEETWGDKAEKNIKDSIDDGSIPESKWYLSRVRRSKYSERSEIVGADGKPITIEYVNDWRKHN